MSIDLKGWYIKTSKNIRYMTAKYSLEVIGANHCWEYRSSTINGVTTVHRDGSGPVWYTADKTHTFEEQLQLVIDNYCGDDTEVPEWFIAEAEALLQKSIELNKPIVSEWV